MQTRQIQLTNVIYNAGTQSFEALVTVTDGDTMIKYPCAINAPISMSFEDATEGLSKQAMRRHCAKSGTFSKVLRQVPQQRAGRPAFDPKGWLESIVHRPIRRAA